MSNLTTTLPDFIISFTSAIRQQVPAIEWEANYLVETNCSDLRKMEDILDTLHSLHLSGFNVNAQHALIKHLSRFSLRLANRYKEKFEREETE
jgi:hypothetical protein